MGKRTYTHIHIYVCNALRTTRYRRLAPIHMPCGVGLYVCVCLITLSFVTKLSHILVIISSTYFCDFKASHQIPGNAGAHQQQKLHFMVSTAAHRYALTVSLRFCIYIFYGFFDGLMQCALWHFVFIAEHWPEHESIC